MPIAVAGLSAGRCWLESSHSHACTYICFRPVCVLPAAEMDISVGRGRLLYMLPHWEGLRHKQEFAMYAGCPRSFQSVRAVDWTVHGWCPQHCGKA